MPESRGSSTPSLLSDDGTYAAVFDVGDGTVIKAYRRRHTTIFAMGDWRDHEAIIKATWANEVRAYSRLMSNSDLRNFVPQSYGPCNPYELIPPAVLGPLQLLKGCGLRLERIDGRAMKLAVLEKDLREVVERTLWRIREAIDPGNVWDSSCFVPGSRADFTIIDFALWDGVDDFSEPLARNGRLSDQQRAHLNRLGAVDDTPNGATEVLANN